MRLRLRLASFASGCALAASARASEFSVSPMNVELRPGAPSETITVANHAATPLRVSIRLMAWTQGPDGQDVYHETGELVYFPRQMDIEPDGKRLVRIGAKSVAGAVERSYRLFIEEQPQPRFDGSRAQVAFFFRFSIPVFVPPAVARPQAEVGSPALEHGTVSLPVRNPGNQHAKILRVVIRDEAGHRQEISGWYVLAGSTRTYAAALPPEVCRNARTLTVSVEGDGIAAERKLDVEPARCK